MRRATGTLAVITTAAIRGRSSAIPVIDLDAGVHRYLSHRERSDFEPSEKSG
jgi:hypothetical protein